MATVIFDPKNPCTEIMWIERRNDELRVLTGSRDELKDRMADGTEILSIMEPELKTGGKKACMTLSPLL